MNGLEGCDTCWRNGVRLFPLTRLMNKHLLPVGREPMIVHGIQKLKDAGIDHIHIVLSKQSAGCTWIIWVTVQNGGCTCLILFKRRPGGIAQALSLVEPFLADDEKIVVLLGDNLFEDSLTRIVDNFIVQGKGGRVILKHVVDPRRYGVPILEW